jgi:type I restriction enzyme, R subunit
LTKDVTQPGSAQARYPANIRTAAQRALFNNMGQDEAIALKLDEAIHANRQDDWRDSLLKTRKVRQAIHWVLDTVLPASVGMQARETGAAPMPSDLEVETDRILDIARHQHEY